MAEASRRTTSGPSVAESPARRTGFRLLVASRLIRLRKMGTTLGADERVQLVNDDEGERRKDRSEAMRRD